MFQEIHTSKGVVKFKERLPIQGSKTLNIEVAKTNLIELKNLLDCHNVKFGLIYGTLLGAIREKAFIKHDEDIDLFLLDEHKESLLSILKEIINIGFEVIRYDGKLLSISKDKEYIDFYFFRKNKLFYRKCEVGLTAKAKYLENTVDYTFLNETFQVPINVESFLVDLYGKNWRVPIKNDPAIGHNKYIIFREWIKKNIPFLFQIGAIIKKNI